MLPRLSLILALACIAPAHAQESFTKSLSPADFQAAGLNKLTPDELAALDALVQGKQTGAITKAKEETAKVVTETVRQQVQAEDAKAAQAVAEAVRQQVRAEDAKAAQAAAETVRQQTHAEDVKAEQKKASSMGIIEKLSVVLKPGTEIQYTTLDAMLVPPFTGWEKGTILTLNNGQRWVVSDEGNYWSPKKDKPIHVRVEPGALGSFFMEIEKGGRPRVKFLDNTSSMPAASP
jgi:hypothetical protein